MCMSAEEWLRRKSICISIRMEDSRKEQSRKYPYDMEVSFSFAYLQTVG